MDLGTCTQCHRPLAESDSAGRLLCVECEPESCPDQTPIVDFSSGSSLFSLALALEDEKEEEDEEDSVDALIAADAPDRSRLPTSRRHRRRLGRWQIVLSNANRHVPDESTEQSGDK